MSWERWHKPINMAIPREDFKKMNIYNYNKLSHLNSTDWAYIAGFLDGDGCILAQIVKRKDYKWKFQIKVSLTFYQHKKRHWFILTLFKKFNKFGFVRVRNDNMSEFSITQKDIIKEILIRVSPYIIAKKELVQLVINIIDSLDQVNNKSDFLEVCFLVDKVAEFTDSKKRINTALMVKSFFDSPVETFNSNEN